MNERLKATDNSPTWRSKTGEIKLEDMTPEYLQNALNFAQEREFFFFNRAQIFTQKIDEIMEEANKRGVVLKLREGNAFHRNQTKKYKKEKS
jgi:hypothetical protein